MGYHLKIDDKAKAFIADKGYDIHFGARPLKRAIQKYLEDLIAEEIINSHLQEDDTVKITLDEKTMSLNVKILKPKKAK
jgi:ATP-dependent Clp protease ATP-binding subunit ClpC